MLDVVSSKEVVDAYPYLHNFFIVYFFRNLLTNIFDTCIVYPLQICR